MTPKITANIPVADEQFYEIQHDGIITFVTCKTCRATNNEYHKFDCPMEEQLIFGIDGNQATCHRGDFVNLQESLCGFGNTNEEALADLREQESSHEGDVVLTDYTKGEI